MIACASEATSFSTSIDIALRICLLHCPVVLIVVSRGLLTSPFLLSTPCGVVQLIESLNFTVVSFLNFIMRREIKRIWCKNKKAKWKFEIKILCMCKPTVRGYPNCCLEILCFEFSLFKNYVKMPSSLKQKYGSAENLWSACLSDRINKAYNFTLRKPSTYF